MVVRDEAYFIEKLKEQIGFLKKSNDAFDNGDYPEAIRLAQALRVLLHDKGSSTSLFMHLGKKDVLFLDTSKTRMSNDVLPTFEGLTSMRIQHINNENKGMHVAPLAMSRINHWASFDSWWNKLVYIDAKGSHFTRSDLVLTIADKEGGAHIDAKIASDFDHFQKSNPLWFSTGTNEFENSPVLPGIRQISYETLKTIERTFPEIKKEL